MFLDNPRVEKNFGEILEIFVIEKKKLPSFLDIVEKKFGQRNVMPELFKLVMLLLNIILQ